MGRVLLACLVLVELLLFHAMTAAAGSETSGPHPLNLTERTGVNGSHGAPSEKAKPPISSKVDSSSSSSEKESSDESAAAPDIRRMGKHHSSDKSVAGGGVIIGGLITVSFAAVFCYIRVTRKKDVDFRQIKF